MIGRLADHSSRFARGELADPERRELLEARSPEGLLRRALFPGCTAALAGLAGMAGVLPAETLVAEAARRPGRAPLPKPRELPIDTFVVLMMENRSFDHYFGWHPRADGRNEGLALSRISTAARASPPTTSRRTFKDAASATPTTDGPAAATSTTAAPWTASTPATPRATAATSTRSATT